MISATDFVIAIEEIRHRCEQLRKDLVRDRLVVLGAMLEGQEKAIIETLRDMPR